MTDLDKARAEVERLKRIKQAQQDITNAAAEYEQVHTACTVAGRKLQQARERLDALLQAPRRDA